MEAELVKKFRAAAERSREDVPVESVAYALNFAFEHPTRPGVIRTLETLVADTPLHVPRVGEAVVLRGFDFVCVSVETEYRESRGRLFQESTVVVDAPAASPAEE